jgi:hypothetical protein
MRMSCVYALPAREEAAFFSDRKLRRCCMEGGYHLLKRVVR